MNKNLSVIILFLLGINIYSAEPTAEQTIKFITEKLELYQGGNIVINLPACKYSFENNGKLFVIDYNLRLPPPPYEADPFDHIESGKKMIRINIEEGMKHYEERIVTKIDLRKYPPSKGYQFRIENIDGMKETFKSGPKRGIGFISYTISMYKEGKMINLDGHWLRMIIAGEEQANKVVKALNHLLLLANNTPELF